MGLFQLGLGGGELGGAAGCGSAPLNVEGPVPAPPRPAGLSAAHPGDWLGLAVQPRQVPGLCHKDSSQSVHLRNKLGHRCLWSRVFLPGLHHARDVASPTECLHHPRVFPVLSPSPVLLSISVFLLFSLCATCCLSFVLGVPVSVSVCPFLSHSLL